MNAAVALKRGAAPPRRRAGASRRAAPPPRATVSLPVGRGRLVRHLAGWFIALLAAAGIVVAGLMGVPQRLRGDFVALTATAGFEVRHVDITGTREMPRLPVYDAALSGPTNAMLTIDLSAIRAKLLQQPWVADASVRRRLPDTLAIDIVERRPVALWQYRRKLTLIDAAGKPLATERLGRFAALPLVVGPGANACATQILALLAGRPELAGKVDAAMYVGRRRWDVKFKTGEVLALPDTDAAAALALKQFARLDARNGGLLGRGFARFDMRLPGRMLVRGAPVKAALDAAAKAAKAAPKPLAI